MATRALQIDLLMTPVIDPTTSAVANGYTVYFYSAGTTTAKNVWTESGKSNAYTSVTLGDGNWESGTAQVYGDGIYKITIKNSDSTTVLEWDNVKIQSNAYNTVSTNQNYTATAEDDIVIVDTSGGNITISLATVAGFSRPIIVKKTTASNTLTIDPSGSQTIDGDSTVTLNDQYEAITIVPDTSAVTWRRANYPINDVYVNDSGGTPFVDTTGFDVETNVTEGTFESVGPTGGGATNTWTPLDNVPLTADFIELAITMQGTTGAVSSNVYARVCVRENGSSADANATTEVATIADRSDGSGDCYCRGNVTVKVPVSSAKFDIEYDSFFTTTTVVVYLVGWGYNGS